MTDTLELANQLERPHYWMCGSKDGHEGDETARVREAAQQLRDLREKLIDARKKIGVQHDECNRYVVDLVDAKIVLKALYEWYDRDGSVSGASEVFEKYRRILGEKK